LTKAALMPKLAIYISRVLAYTVSRMIDLPSAN
jgi:hypothetical protein